MNLYISRDRDFPRNRSTRAFEGGPFDPLRDFVIIQTVADRRKALQYGGLIRPTLPANDVTLLARLDELS